MANKTIQTNKVFRVSLIVYIAIFVIGIIMCFFGIKLDINFSGGTRITYSYTGDVKEADFDATVKEFIQQDYKLTQNTSLAGDAKTYTINLIGRKALDADVQENVTKALEEKFKDNKIDLYDSTSVSPTVAGTFFLKSMVAVILTAVFVVIYVGFRFRKIGGISAALTALCALVFDVLVSFFVCVIFRLQIDSNYIAVVLTLLGYSLNDTIVVYDRVRENNKLYPQLTVGELMDRSISGVISRNIVTTVTTVLAVLTIIVVSELYGLSSLRTFAIPMVFGLLSGCISSMFVAGPLWVLWKNRKAKKEQK